MDGILGKLFDAIKAPRSSGKKGGVLRTPSSADAGQGGVITVPDYRNHLSDLFTNRQTENSQELMKRLFQQDPDVSGAVNAYMTLADTPYSIIVRDAQDEIDTDATKALRLYTKRFKYSTDYTQGYSFRTSLETKILEMRYMLLLRSGVGIEAVLDKTGEFSELRSPDMASIEWSEEVPGSPKPSQIVEGQREPIDLNIPTFFTTFFRRDPGTLYPESYFVAAINSIAARQQIINDLYRIMQITGFPRMDVEVMEEVLRNSAPSEAKSDPEKMQQFMRARFGEVEQQFTDLSAQDIIIHSDSVKPRILNEDNPSAQLNISEIIETLNHQNQAALKSMSVMLGRSKEGVNTASVEARVAAMAADGLNRPIEEILSRVLTFIMHFKGYQGYVEVTFQKAELRPDLELEGQRQVRQTRLLKELSLGLISDTEYHLMVHNRPAPDGAPQLSGTGFLDANKTAEAPNPEDNSLNRSLKPEGEGDDTN